MAVGQAWRSGPKGSVESTGIEGSEDEGSQNRGGRRAGRDRRADLLRRPGVASAADRRSDVSESFNFNIVNFAAGARNRLHVHTSDQILFVTKGEGLVGTDDEVAEVTVGDTVFIPAGEARHWHGASDESDFSHVALMTPLTSTRHDLFSF